VKAENDWISKEVAQYPDRLIGFCGINPLKDYALQELARCAKIPQLRHGLKLHFGNSEVDYHNAQNIEQLRRVFRAANDFRMAIVVHMRPSVTLKMTYGRDEALIFLNEILPAALDVVVQIAHLGGPGGYGPLIDQALSVFSEAISKDDPRTKHLWFDVTTVVDPRFTGDQKTLLATRLRALGVGRILYGSDAPSPTNLPRDGWATFRQLPLSDEELQIIANNVPPYMR
jgi:uncharacterized protein